MPVQSPERLTVQENALAAAMLHRISNATVQFAVTESGDHHHSLPVVGPQEFNTLTNAFAADPTRSLVWVRESLSAIGHDDRLSPAMRKNRLSRYLDAYADLTIKLDHAAFPADDATTVHEGIPSYIADGYADMGRQSSRNSVLRARREQIWVDKHAIFTRFKPVLTEIFQADYSGMPVWKKQLSMANRLSQEVYFSMPGIAEEDAPDGEIGWGVDKVRLSEVTESVCRHKALAYQVLGQAVGLDMRLMKGYMNGTRHVANFQRVNGDWYLEDPTSPDYHVNGEGQKVWEAVRYPIDRPPSDENEVKKYKVTQPISGKQHTYIARGDDQYWHIEHPPWESDR
jgi:hypothetical protein